MSHPDPMDPSCASAEVRHRAEGVEYEARQSMKGLRDGRLDGVRIGIPIVSHPIATVIYLARTDRLISALIRIGNMSREGLDASRPRPVHPTSPFIGSNNSTDQHS
jgi:hypothetical protein